jgi:hypothetical protein
MSILARFFNKSQPALYRLIAPRSSEVLGPWATQFPAFDEVVGHSSLGHFFLRNSGTQEYAVLHPFKRAIKSYGSFASVDEFEKATLKEVGFREFVFAPTHVEAIAKRLGQLEQDQIYIPQPYPFIGGSCEPSTYDKGDVWVFASIVAQMQGL